MRARVLKYQIALAMIATSLIVAPSVANASKPPQPASSVGAATDLPLTRAVAHAKFVNQYGQEETLGALKGKTIFLVPFLTLCGDTCPFTTAEMIQLQSALEAKKATDIELVGIDVDPYRDTPARIAAYSKLISANFQLWTESGTTSVPYLTAKEISSKNPVGKGDINANLSAVEKFLHWSVQVVPQSVPPNNDWMAPHDQLSYDINHSDGFFIINSQQSVQFVSGDLPYFTGTLSKTLSSFMGYKSNVYKKAVYANGWTPTQALKAIEYVTGKEL